VARYLGSAAYDVVWRYIPVPTAEIYWQRVQKGLIQLTTEEGEIMSQVGGISIGWRVREGDPVEWMMDLKEIWLGGL
jgi:hypothetical protein